MWLLIVKRKVKKVYYVSNKVNGNILRLLSKKIPFERKIVVFSTSTHLRFEKNLYNFTEEIFSESEFARKVRSLLNRANYDTETLITAAKKQFLSYLNDDVQAITIAQDSKRNNECRYVLVKEYGLLKKIFVEDIEIGRSFSPVFFVKEMQLFILRSLWRLKGILTKIGKKKPEAPTEIKFVFEQSYKGQEGNPEFKAFYRYFEKRDDVFYVCVSKDSDIRNELIADGKHVMVKDEISFSVERSLKLLKLFFVMFLKTVFSGNLRSYRMNSTIINIVYFAIYYENLFYIYSPVFYLKVRSDLAFEHLIATAVGRKYNVFHIGYQHGTYSFFMAQFAYIEFEYYGLLGKCFLDDLFSKTWSKDTNYKLLGPILAEEYDEKGIKLSNNRFVVSVFSVDVAGRQFGEYSFEHGMEDIIYALTKLDIQNLHIIFKLKGFTLFSDRLICRLCGESGLSFEIAYHCHPTKVTYGYSREILEKVRERGMGIHERPENINVSISSQEVISISDIVISSSVIYSTIDWEALGKQKKLIIFTQNDPLIFPHPFEKYFGSNNLVARNRDELEDKVGWLLRISNKKYQNQIKTATKSCCKISTGFLVRDFIESIEEENKFVESIR